MSVVVTATYAFLGTELICVTFGEASNPRHTIPRAIRLTFFRIIIFYVRPSLSISQVRLRILLSKHEVCYQLARVLTIM
jgi:amino acid permease